MFIKLTALAAARLRLPVLCSSAGVARGPWCSLHDTTLACLLPSQHGNVSLGLSAAGGVGRADEFEEEGSASSRHRRLLASAAAEPLLRRCHRVPEEGGRSAGDPEGGWPPETRSAVSEYLSVWRTGICPDSSLPVYLHIKRNGGCAVFASKMEKCWTRLGLVLIHRGLVLRGRGLGFCRCLLGGHRKSSVFPC